VKSVKLTDLSVIPRPTRLEASTKNAKALT
jgi:hypothetical protein